MVNSIEENVKSYMHNEEVSSDIVLEHIHISQHIYPKLKEYLLNQQYTNVGLIFDENTMIFKEQIIQQCEHQELTFSEVRLEKNDQEDVIANEQNIVKVITFYQQTNCSVLIAVGSGTIHDVVRYVAYTLNIPFIAFPTAPSVDGYYSSGAPIIVQNQKITITAKTPIAIFADTDILKESPDRLIAAGVGDILGKYTSIFDWKFEVVWRKGELYQPTLQLTEKALKKTVDALPAIQNRELEGITLLTEALIESGIGIALYGQSNAASGSEHHLSHYWEMDHLLKNEKQILHGEKVGVAAIEILRLYKALFPIVYQNGTDIDEAQWIYLKEELDKLPSDMQLAQMLQLVKGKTKLEQLPISNHLFHESIFNAPSIRANRYTFLRYLITHHEKEIEKYVTNRTQEKNY